MASLVLVNPAAATPPEAAGVYLLYDGPEQPPDAETCRRRLEETQATDELASTLLFGELPYGHPAADASFLIVSQGRMDATSFAEGDVENGSVILGVAQGDSTPFVLFPDSDPTLALKGTIEMGVDGVVAAVTIEGIPIDDAGGTVDRMTHYCRVEEGVAI